MSELYDWANYVSDDAATAVQQEVKALLKQQREKCADIYYEEEHTSCVQGRIINAILNAPEPEIEK